MPDTYLTTAQAARVLECSQKTILRYIKTGRLTAYKPAGRWRIRADDIDTFVLSGQRSRL